MGRRSVTGESSSRRRTRRLGRPFFDRPTVTVARALLGSELRVRDADGVRRARIVETEAYVANDPASHAYRGPTPRNRSMFEAPGTLYVYRIHQVDCANLVTRRGEAVLLRSGEPLSPQEGNPSGPGRLCRYLGLGLADDGANARRSRRVGVWSRARRPGRIVVGPRVGLSRARARLLRFAIDGDPWVSAPRLRSGSVRRDLIPPRRRTSAV